MKIQAAIWNGSKSRLLAIENFNSTKELQDFMKELHIVDSKASYNLTEVSK